MSEQAVIKGYVSKDHLSDYKDCGASMVPFQKLPILMEGRDWAKDPATLILGNGFSEETVRMMLPYMEHKSGCKADFRWWLRSGAKPKSPPPPCSCGLAELLERLA